MTVVTGYSPVIQHSGDGPSVELAEDHPGVSDPEYRARRNAIAALSVDHQPGEPFPDVDYTEQEHDVWRVVSKELKPLHDHLACAAYREAAEDLVLPTDHVPQLREVSELLAPITGFSYEPVAGLAPLREFYGSFAERRFFSTQYLRHHSVPLYTPEPDIIHEVIGHANQLACPEFAAIYSEVGQAVGRTESPEALAWLSRVFWFTLEFGVVTEDGEPKAYGAGILSSYGELGRYRDAEIRPMDFAEMGGATYDITKYQPVLYGASDFPSLVDSLMEFYSSFDDEVYERLA